jgi:hypothetical protein
MQLKSVDTVHSISPEKFKKNYYNLNKPYQNSGMNVKRKNYMH